MPAQKDISPTAPAFRYAAQLVAEAHTLALLATPDQLSQLGLDQEQEEFARQQWEQKAPYVLLPRLPYLLFLVLVPEKPTPALQREAVRALGFTLQKACKDHRVRKLQLQDLSSQGMVTALAEGLTLSSYEFGRHKTETTAGKVSALLQELTLTGGQVTEAEVTELQHLIQAVFLTRNLVNEPANFLTAAQLGREAQKLGETCGFRTEVLDKIRIESLKMGGLLSVNLGSQAPPTFSILE